jgi:hypothetical protein
MSKIRIKPGRVWYSKKAGEWYCFYCKWGTLHPDGDTKRSLCKKTGPDGMVCCRKPGHRGPHVACGICEKEHPISPPWR